MKRGFCLFFLCLAFSANILCADDAPFLLFDGTDYLETDYTPTPQTRVEIDFALTDATVQQFLLHAGSDVANDLHLRVYVNGNGGYSWTFSDEKNFTPFVDAQGHAIPVVLERRQVATLDGARGEVSFCSKGESPHVVKMDTARTVKTRTFPLRLFSNRHSGRCTKGRLYGLKIWEKGTLVHDYRPVRENDETMLADVVTGKRLRTVESQNPFRTILTPVGALKGVEGHVQGIACSDEAIYLSFITTLVKLDWKGNVLKIQPARRHMGDIAYRKGRLYGCLGKTKDPNVGLGGMAYIQVFDADLNFVGEKRVPSAPGIDGIGILGDNVYVGGGSKEGDSPHLRNLVVKLDGKLEPVVSNWVDYGVKTIHGVQNITIADGKVWCFLYTAESNAPGCVVLDTDLKPIKVVSFTAGNGVDVLPPRFGTAESPRFLVCRTLYPKDGTGTRAELRFVQIQEAAVPLTAKP